mgnify:FL=1|jgi:hypothetical protein
MYFFGLDKSQRKPQIREKTKLSKNYTDLPGVALINFVLKGNIIDSTAKTLVA